MADFTAINETAKAEPADCSEPSVSPLKTPKTTSKRKKAQEGTPSKKAKSENTAKARKIAESFDDLSEEDKMLLTWKDNGTSWGEINAEWERITGDKPGKSTLPNRYPRLKANLSAVTSEHLPLLVSSEATAIEEIENEIKDLWTKKWVRVAKHMEEAGATYPPATLEKQSKKLAAAAIMTAPATEVDNTHENA